ncbi:hypothetical protein [Streptosporangium sp. NPDC000396]|uniref:hypothetical protein n=1 Tax=Streptosporangium sp. NPDC000396 TaxID=3366185 RepID=UPI0036BC8157
MRNIDDLVRPLARVEPGKPGGRSSGAGARALLASITAEEPDMAVERPRRARVYGPRRLVLGLAAAAALATGVVVGPSLLEDGRGVATSYASTEIDIRLEGDEYVARIKDPYADHEKYSKAFKAVGLDVEVSVAPVSPRAVGQVVSGSADNGSGTGSWTAGTEDAEGKECKAGEEGCFLLLRIPADMKEAWFKLGRQAEPGEAYQNAGDATAEGEELAGVKVRGRSVGKVMAEVRKRGLTAEFTLVVPQDNEGHGEEPLTAEQAGDDWTVWDAVPVKAGTVRLMVTREHLDHNPLYAPDSPPES